MGHTDCFTNACVRKTYNLMKTRLRRAHESDDVAPLRVTDLHGVLVDLLRRRHALALRAAALVAPMKVSALLPAGHAHRVPGVAAAPASRRLHSCTPVSFAARRPALHAPHTASSPMTVCVFSYADARRLV